MNILTDRVPEHVEIGGVQYRINTDFRAGIRFEQAIIAEAVSEDTLLAYYPEAVPPDVEAAIDRILWFYRCGDSAASGGGQRGVARREYDFEQDSDALYASFMTTYDIDLSVADLHWWVFRKLMWGLPSETPFMQRIHYRTADVSDMSKHEKKRYQKMKTLYALKRGPNEKLTLEERNQRMRDHVAKCAERVEKACQKR